VRGGVAEKKLLNGRLDEQDFSKYT